MQFIKNKLHSINLLGEENLNIVKLSVGLDLNQHLVKASLRFALMKLVQTGLDKKKSHGFQISRKPEVKGHKRDER